jgi:hypothetical protein
MNLFSRLFVRTADRPQPRRFPAPTPASHFRPRLESLAERLVPSFTPVTPSTVGSAPQSVATADLNGDGRLDLITANQGTYNSATGT